MNEAYQKCAGRMKEIAALMHAADLLSWDRETMMPEKGGGARAMQAQALAGVIHEKTTDPSLSKALKALRESPAALSEDEIICVREWIRDVDKACKLPEDLVKDLARVTSLAHQTWMRARRESDFSIFAPHLKEIVSIKRRQADAIGYDGVRYDALLDEFEHGATVAKLDPIIDSVRRAVVPLVSAIRDRGAAVDAKFLCRRFPEKEQEELGREVIKALGLDPKAYRLDRSAHPFCIEIAPSDVRITTRYDAHNFTESLYGVIHETGHALYVQGLDESNMGNALGQVCSMGIHESQSRLIENHIGRSKAFASFLFPQIKKKFARQLSGVGLETFYRAVNRVRPSPIRTEADEVTYSLHVVVRYEIEKELISGEIEVEDLPRIWNDRMEEYLGIRPKDDAEGVLQDIHWSIGAIGYFPTYLLGNLYAAQLWAKIEKTIPGVNKKIAKGEFSPIVKWLRQNIHSQGRRYPPMELVERATSMPFSADHYISYLKKKYGEIYKIKL